MARDMIPVSYRVGEVEVEPAQACLRRDGREFQLRAKSLQVLLCLLENRTRIVTREELLRTVWDGAAVTDDVLTQCIGDLRRALGDDPRNPRYIKTVPKLGFRLLGDVSELTHEPAAVAVAPAASFIEVETTTAVQVEMIQDRPARGALPWVLLVAAVIALAWSWLSRAPGPERGKTVVAVMFFENRTNRQDLDWLREGLADMLITNLCRSPRLALIDRERARALLHRAGHLTAATIPLDTALVAARHGQAQTAILGAFTAVGSGLRLDLQFFDVPTGKFNGGESLTVERIEELLPKFNTLSVRVAMQLKAPFPGGAETATLSEASTGNLEAFRAYVLGVELAEQYHAAEAIAQFEKATQLDPGFAMAHARIGYVYSMSAGKADEGRPYLEKAFRLSDRLSERDRQYIAAWYFVANGDFEAAIRAYRRIVEQYPGDLAAYVSLARLLRGERRHAEALTVLLKGRALDPDWGDIHNVLSGVYFENGHTDLAIASAQRFVELAPGEANAYDSLGIILHRAGRYHEAIESYRSALRLKPDFDIAVIHLGNTLCSLGRYREAVEQFRKFELMSPFSFQRARAR